MTDGNLHEVSVEIGKLTAQVQALTKAMAEQSVHAAKLEAKVDDLTRLKHKGAGLLLGVGMMGSAIGSAITFVVQWMNPS